MSYDKYPTFAQVICHLILQ